MSDVIRLRGEKLEWREIEGEIVLLDGEAAEYVAVNRTGTVLWPRLQAGATREELAARLVESFDVDEATAARDVDVFVQVLCGRGLLEG